MRTVSRASPARNDKTALPTERPQSFFGRWLREPLFHFLIIGALLFVIYDVRQRKGAGADASRRIQFSADDVRLLDASFEAQWSRPPTAPEHSALVEGKVREEILYREALALGLDREDPIVKRRVAQKMEFLADDASTLREPTAAELHAFFDTNTARFAQPSRVTFRHLYFSPAQRGDHARKDAEAVLQTLAGQPTDSPPGAGLADTFMFQDYYSDFSTEQLEPEFGSKFVEELLRTKPGSWQGPILSSRGWHLALVEAIVPARAPNFAEAEPLVKSAWLAAQINAASEKAYQRLRAKYDIILPAVTATSSIANINPPKP